MSHHPQKNSCPQSRGRGQHSVGWYYGGQCEWCGVVRQAVKVEGEAYAPYSRHLQVRMRENKRRIRRIRTVNSDEFQVTVNGIDLSRYLEGVSRRVRAPESSWVPRKLSGGPESLRNR